VRRLPVILLLGGLGAGLGATALAQGGAPYDVPEPSVTSRQVLHMPSAAHCLDRTLVTVRITPPPGAVLGWLHVRVNGHESVRLTGIPHAASASLRLGAGRGGRVTVAGETLGGQQVSAARVYRACPERPPRSRPAPPPLTGGGNS
jgi:hypothetical protein